MSNNITVRGLTEDEDPAIDDGLLISDTDGGSTKKATIKNVVKKYNEDLDAQRSDPTNIRSGKGPLAEVVFDNDGNQIYREDVDGNCAKYEYDEYSNKVYLEDSRGFWWKKEYDNQGNEIYYEDSDGIIIDNRNE